MKRNTLIVLGLALAVFSAACKQERMSIDTATTIPVRTVEVQPKSIQEVLTATGTAYPVSDLQLKTEQAGYYRLRANPRTGVPYRMGDAVRGGEVLVSLENPEVVNQIAMDSKKLQFDSAQREFTKQQSIYDKGGITLKELSDAERAFVDAKHAIESATLSLAKLEIKAPFDGVLADLPHLTAGGWVAAGTLVARIVDYSRLYVELTLPGKDMDRIARGQAVQVNDYGAASVSSNTAQGTVSQISPALDPASRMFKLKVDIANPRLVLKPGSFVKADIVVQEKPSAIVVAKSVILDRGGNKIVYVVDRGMAAERRLKTGIENKDEVEILEGLQAKDQLIIEGFETLRNRSQVKVIQ
jgi:membrane fusion protein (multidrug efflux system)